MEERIAQLSGLREFGTEDEETLEDEEAREELAEPVGAAKDSNRPM